MSQYPLLFWLKTFLQAGEDDFLPSSQCFYDNKTFSLNDEKNYCTFESRDSTAKSMVYLNPSIVHNKDGSCNTSFRSCRSSFSSSQNSDNLYQDAGESWNTLPPPCLLTPDQKIKVNETALSHLPLPSLDDNEINSDCCNCNVNGNASKIVNVSREKTASKENDKDGLIDDISEFYDNTDCNFEVDGTGYNIRCKPTNEPHKYKPPKVPNPLKAFSYDKLLLRTCGITINVENFDEPEYSLSGEFHDSLSNDYKENNKSSSNLDPPMSDGLWVCLRQQREHARRELLQYLHLLQWNRGRRRETRNRFI